MSYVQLSDLVGRIPNDYLTQALDDDNDGVADAWDSVAASASGAVNGFLSTRFAVPFRVNIPQVVIEAAIIFACELCYKRRSVANEQNPFYEDAKAMRVKLANIALGKEPLQPGAVPVNKSGGAVLERAPTFSNAGLRMT